MALFVIEIKTVERVTIDVPNYADAHKHAQDMEKEINGKNHHGEVTEVVVLGLKSQVTREELHRRECKGCCPDCGEHCPDEGGTSCGGSGLRGRS